jgi:hypothetical protein
MAASAIKRGSTVVEKAAASDSRMVDRKRVRLISTHLERGSLVLAVHNC